MEIRLAKQEDITDLKKLWGSCFGDTESFIDFYFRKRDWLSETAVLEAGGKTVSMLTMIPVELNDQEGVKTSASMLYAIATHPDCQKRGYADRLIEFSNQYLLSKQIAVTLLVPASGELFGYYSKRGYRNGFYIRETILTRADAAALPGEGQPFSIVPVSPGEYNTIRKDQLKGHPYIDYRDDEVIFLKQLATLFGAELYSISAGNAVGCTYAERISDEEVIVKELLLPDPYIITAVKRITELMPAEKYIIRTPAFTCGLPGGRVKPFGMLRINREGLQTLGADKRSAAGEAYLGIAYD